MLNVTGSGILCVPWWYGCGAYLAVESQGWVLPIPWAPDAADIGFSVRITGRDRVRVTGAEQAGNDRIEPGAYTLVVIRTSRPEGVTPEPTMSAAVGCAVDLDVPPGTRVVSVDVEFSGPACTIEASLDAASAAPSP